MEKGAFDYFGKLDAMGGMVKAIERGYPQKEVAEASYQFQRAAEAKEKIIVGANNFVIEENRLTSFTSMRAWLTTRARSCERFEREGRMRK